MLDSHKREKTFAPGLLVHQPEDKLALTSGVGRTDEAFNHPYGA